MPLSKLTPLKRQTLSFDVYDQFKDLLMSGRMIPGEQISLRGIASAFGVSVMPVREAVHRLTAEQALELTPKRALRVPMMTVSQFREITTIRINLEGLATERAAQLLSAAAIAKIAMLNSLFSEEMAKPKPDGAKLIVLNKAFHFAVYDGARMPTLMKLIEVLWVRIGPILNYDLRSGSRRVSDGVAASHHGRLVEALMQNDSAAARDALRGDIETAADFIVSAGVLIIADPT